ncbi:hypothetical protein [Aquaspirillum serpens]|uniref:hypothetical protein n=1 Tax=Aquaspirillum serpens TaxID=190 RepID=UPI0003B40869|nr:hypothetical protein [Aquaspirillum serpens]
MSTTPDLASIAQQLERLTELCRMIEQRSNKYDDNPHPNRTLGGIQILANIAANLADESAAQLHLLQLQQQSKPSS